MEAIVTESEFDKPVDKDVLTNIIRKNITTVTFTKVNGEDRVMKCTLDPKYLPKIDGVVEESGRPENPNVVVVWDIEKEGWRSFRLDSVRTVQWDLP